ncbi:MAG TPA: DNA repair protein RecN [Acidimicrobiia bacterium]|nr:DNA repair protein RecN [Acidimicrobiia bacterium]
MSDPVAAMLTELRVEGLGIIDDLHILLGPGLTVVTGETGAGKTLLVDAVELLLGGRADTDRVRAGVTEARVEGRFIDPTGEEVVLARAVPAGGARSRAYVDGRLATAGELADRGQGLVEMHGQHAHQALLVAAEQRDALDRAGGEQVARAAAGYTAARAEVRRIESELAALGGEPRARARELDLLRFQLDEITDARIEHPDEDEELAAREGLLANADEHREALAEARTSIDDRALDAVGTAVDALADRAPFAPLAARVRSLQAELADVAHELRLAADGVEVDPDQLAAVRQRRQQLRELQRKYGDSLTEVLDYAATLCGRISDLEAHDARSTELAGALGVTESRMRDAADELTKARHLAAGPLAAAVTERLADLGMSDVRFSVTIEPSASGERGADAVSFLLAANRGEPLRPLTKVASGGELARTMLALRVVLASGARLSTERDGESSPTALVFDEVDAGLGGEAGRAVGRALAELAATRPVLCVTHLAQVAAFADTHVVVEKHAERERTVADATIVIDEARVSELSRMLAGVDGSHHAQRHAEELLADAERPKMRSVR